MDNNLYENTVGRKEKSASEGSLITHSILLDTASRISKPLHDALEAIGPISIPSRSRQSLGYHLSKTIVGQQLSIRAASSIWGRIEKSAQLAGIGIPDYFIERYKNEIRQCGVSMAKLRALMSVCNAESRGELHGPSLARLEPTDRSKRLLKIFGVGQWTCDMVSIFYFRSPDVWPLGDAAVQKQFKMLVSCDDPNSAAEKFEPHRTFLALAMYKIANSTPQ